MIVQANRKKLRLGIIGCGAVAECFHLPIVAISERVNITALVDKSLSRARSFADRYNVPTVIDDYQKVLGDIDAAIISLPHHLHGPVGIELLKKGIHVLVEKPMALTSEDCDRMIEAAAKTEATLTVGLLRRYYPSSRLVKNVIERGMLGKITAFDFREGCIYDWNVTSDFMFRKDAGGGVLADTGAHVLDLLLWWLGDYRSVEYYDDSRGGVEADCEIHLELQSGAKGIVELSRTRKLRNTCLISGEHGTLEIGTHLNSPVRLSIAETELSLDGRANRKCTAERSMKDLFTWQLNGFLDAIDDRNVPFVSGLEGRRAVRLMERCRAGRRVLKFPWDVVVADLDFGCANEL
jgi:predicted dehydrogenase